MEFIKPGSKINFMGKRHVALGISGVVMVLSIILMFAPGIKWGIDFSGGTEIQLAFDKPITVGEIREALSSANIPDGSVQRFGDEEKNEFLVRLQGTNFGGADTFKEAQSLLETAFAGKVSDFKATEDSTQMKFKKDDGLDANAVKSELQSLGSVLVRQDPADRNLMTLQFGDPSQQMSRLLKGALPNHQFEVLRVDSVGPKVGGELRNQGVLAVFFTTILLLIYIAFRFNTEFAPGAIACLVHDVMVCLAVLIVTESEFALSTVAAVLTVVGYSLNDTIVVFDRIRENQQRYRDMDQVEVINRSINETLSRTVLTSTTTFIVVFCLFLFGGSIIHDFALALLVGVIVGTYSSIFVASPIVIITRNMLGDPEQEEDEDEMEDEAGAPSAAY